MCTKICIISETAKFSSKNVIHIMSGSFLKYQMRQCSGVAVTIIEKFSPIIWSFEK